MPQPFSYHYVGEPNSDITGLDRQTPAILSVAKTRNEVSDRNKLHFHPYLEIFYFTDGEGFMEWENDSAPLKKNDVAVINAQVFHRQYSAVEGRELTFYSLFVSDIRMPGLPYNCLTEGAVRLLSFSSDDNEVFRLIETITKEASAGSPGGYLSVRGMTFQLIAALYRQLTATTADPVARLPRVSRLAEKAKRFIDEKYADNLTLEKIAGEIFVSKDYLNHLFKKNYKISPIQYLIGVRIDRAKKLLCLADKPIGEIAAEVGFSTPVYFSEMFRKYQGMSPREFRNICNELNRH